MAGDEGVADAFTRQGLPLTLVDSPDELAPWRDLFALYHRASEITRVRSIGLEAGGDACVGDRGIYGKYITQAPTLLGAIERSLKVLPHFESGSERSIRFTGDKLVFGYRNRLQGLNGWRHVCSFKICLANCLFKTYLGDDWRPDLIEVSIPKGTWEQDYEDFFSAPVHFGKDMSALVLSRELAHTPKPPTIPTGPPVAFAEIVRRGKPIPKTFVSAVANVINRRMENGRTDFEGAAWALGLGLRTVQRRLSEDGLTYRDLLLRCKMRRACDLLNEPGLSTSQISRECGYASSSQFHRAFKSVTGATPREIRMSARNSARIDGSDV